MTKPRDMNDASDNGPAAICHACGADYQHVILRGIEVLRCPWAKEQGDCGQPYTRRDQYMARPL